MLGLIFTFISGIALAFTSGIKAVLIWTNATGINYFLRFLGFINSFLDVIILIVMVIFAVMALCGKRIKIPGVWNSGKKILAIIDKKFSRID